MQVDLGQQRIIKLIITKGRVAQSKGRQATPFFYIKYRREATGVWFEYRKDNGTQRLNGNRDAMTENYNTMEPPFVARFIRIYPFSLEPTQTCLKIELLGCDAQGVAEYQVPQGTFLSDALVPTYTYEPRQLDPRTRFQDYGYDFLQPDGPVNGRSSLHYPVFGQSRNPSGSHIILRGGLGKLTDNDTELNKDVRPFSSFKYMGWKRRFSRRHPKTSWSHEDEHVRILFRFDAIYNFTAVRLFLANDFPQDVSIPRNITVQCSLHYPASTEHRPDSSIPLVVSNLQMDRTNSVARWIVLIPSQAQWYMTVPKAADKGSGSSSTVGTVGSGENGVVPSSLGIGRFVDIRLYFDASWIVLGEVAFENEKLDLNEMQAKSIHSLYKSKNRNLSTNGHGRGNRTPPNNRSAIPTEDSDTTDTAKSGSSSSSSSPFTIGHSTMTLGTICGVLAALIGVGVICLCFLWRQKRMRSRFEHHFHRGKRPLNGVNHFDCLSEVQTPHSLPSSSQHYQHHPSSELTNPTGNGAASDSCDPGQTTTPLYVTNRAPLVFSAQNHTEFIPTLSGPFSQLIEPNYPADLIQHSSNLTGDLTARHVRGEFDASRFTFGDQVIPSSTVAPQSVQFIPFVSPQVTHIDFRAPLNSIDTLKRNGHQEDPFLLLPIHDGAIYTSLPGSDCDSQPYARVGNGDTERRYSRSVDFQGKPFDPFVPCAKQQQQQQYTSEDDGFHNLPQSVNSHSIFSTLMPPPPNLPLPMPPGPVFSSSPSQSSTSHSQTPGDLANSGAPLVSTDSMNGVGLVNGCGSIEQRDFGKPRWLHVKRPTLGPNHGLPLTSNHLKFARGPQQQQTSTVHSHPYPITDPNLHLQTIHGKSGMDGHLSAQHELILLFNQRYHT
ncbi:hypothetical protein FGIG_02213 [Fasciola gigantica]|uniref:F5/8 type C domain-containing protein n=1 Tax=Fasciola gigantica TaxID=46835 RepID=A0A504YW70_FASGI|nr:hypothetical protein FGIG_02213 [Fasciola gigantica]